MLEEKEKKRREKLARKEGEEEKADSLCWQ